MERVEKPTVPLLLHAVWREGYGLHMWVERPEGHKIVKEVDQLEVPAHQRGLFAVLDRGSRARMELKLRTPKGHRVEREVPTWVFPPWVAVEVLATLQEYTGSAAMAPDLRFFVDVVQGLDAFARSGRALVALTWEDNEWWPTWRLPEGLTEIAWQAQVAALAPPVLIDNGGANMAEEFINRMFHWVTNALLADLDEPAPQRQAFVRALLESESLGKAAPGVAQRLARWRMSADTEEVRLQLMIEEPVGFSGQLEDLPELDLPQLLDLRERGATDLDGVGVGGAGGAGAGASETDRKMQWPLRMYYRAGVAAPQRLNPEMCRRSVLSILRPQLLDAQRAFPVLKQAQAAGSGLDLMLTSEQLIELMTTGISALAEVGIDVMLPPNWKSEETTLALEVAGVPLDPIGPAGRRSEPKLGFDQLVDYEWNLAVGDTVLTEPEMRQLAASSTGLVHIRDRWIHANPEVAREALRFLVEQTKAGEETGKGQATLRELVFDGGLESAAPPAVPVQPQDASWLKAVIEQLDEVVSDAGAEGSGGSEDGLPAKLELPPSFVGELRDYQERGVKWLADMSHRGFGVILADDMGLGKTVQILALLEYEKARRQEATAEAEVIDVEVVDEVVDAEMADSDAGAGGDAGADTDAGAEEKRKVRKKVDTTLLVVPTGVLRNWAAEAIKFTPELKVGLLHGSGRPKGEELEKFIAEHDLVVTTYGVATRDRVELSEVIWEHVIADEAQAIKNPNSQASRALRSFHSRHNIAMTGTPVENDLGELRTIMDFCNPGMLGSAREFRTKFAIPIERDGSAEMLLQLQAITGPFILRRLKSDPAIAPDLPKKNEQVEMVALTAEQAFLYQEAVKDLEEKMERAKQLKFGDMRRRSIIFGGIMKLKQICNHPAHYQHDGSGLLDHGQHRSGKVALLEQLVDEIVEAGERALVFTQFVEFGQMLAPYFSKRFGVDIPFIEGSMTPKQREKVVSEFNSPDGPPIILLSTLAAGVGINLVAANHVIHVDRWWNPAVENQATDRSYRIGQRKDVHVHKLVSVGTLEERIDELIFEKAELADAVVRAGETKLTEMDFHRLRSLWKLDESRIQTLRDSGEPMSTTMSVDLDLRDTEMQVSGEEIRRNKAHKTLEQAMEKIRRDFIRSKGEADADHGSADATRGADQASDQDTEPIPDNVTQFKPKKRW